MPVFSSGRHPDRPTHAPSGQATQLSILGPGLRVVGDIECDGVIKIEGRLEGGIRGSAQVLVASGGVVAGSVSAAHIVVEGRVEGDIAAATRVELGTGGVVHGDIAAPLIVVQDGGEVNGRVRMRRPAATAMTTQPLKNTA